MTRSDHQHCGLKLAQFLRGEMAERCEPHGRFQVPSLFACQSFSYLVAALQALQSTAHRGFAHCWFAAVRFTRAFGPPPPSLIVTIRGDSIPRPAVGEIAPGPNRVSDAGTAPISHPSVAPRWRASRRRRQPLTKATTGYSQALPQIQTCRGCGPLCGHLHIWASTRSSRRRVHAGCLP